jgi:hypothetical protein
MVTPTDRVQTRTETVPDELFASPMAAIARADTRPGAGCEVWEGEEDPWIAYSSELREAEVNAVVTRKK